MLCSWIGLLIDEDEEPRVCHLRQDAFGAADLPLARLTVAGLVGRLECGIGHGKRRQQPRTFFVRQSGRSQKLLRSVLQGQIG
jgi:hypothetical protein